MRLFFALWPPARAARSLYAWAQHAARQTRGRATRAETIHLTLAFLGEVDEQNLPLALKAGRAAGGRAHSLFIEQARWWKHNRIVWVGPNEPPGPLACLEVELKKNLLEEGFELETRPFAAHVTLVRKAQEPSGLPPLPEIDWPVAEFVLVRSVLSPEGSRYEVLGRFALDQKTRAV